MFIACQEQLGVAAEECFVVVDVIWDLLAARRARMLGIGLLTGGMAKTKLFKTGAYRIFKDPSDLLKSIDELGLTH